MVADVCHSYFTLSCKDFPKKISDIKSKPTQSEIKLNNQGKIKINVLRHLMSNVLRHLMQCKIG